MTVQVNFLPKAYQRRCRRSRRIQRWAVVCAAVVVAQGLSAHFLAVMAKDVRDSRGRLAGMERDIQDMNIRLARLTAQQRDLSRRVQLVDRLGRKHQWSNVLTTLAGHMPPTITLTDLRTDPPKGQSAHMPTSGGASAKNTTSAGLNTRTESGTATGFVIAGVATDHESIAHFMQALNNEAQWGRCQLESTSRRPFKDGEAVGFTIRMRWQ